MQLFRDYAEVSGQHLGLEKCKFYVGSMSASRIVSISRFLGFSAGHLPFTYLGVPLFKVKPKRMDFEPIVDKIKTKLAGWKGSCLSVMGRLQLVKSVIHGMTSYSFQIYPWPASLLKAIDK